MSSLVAYEDSESEDEEGSAQVEDCKQNQRVMLCNETVETPKSRSLPENTKILEYHGYIPEKSNYFQSERGIGWERKHCISEAQDDKPFENPAAPLSKYESKGKFTPRHGYPGQPHGSNPAKRQSTAPSCVRPYIPKRQRLTPSQDTLDPHHSAEQVVGSQTKESQILSEGSVKLKPYLSQKPSAAGIPRRLLMSLEGHQGPVNTLKWCPVPHLSHLLLSASMDKTFKVWDGAESGRCLRVYTCHSGAVRDACWTPCGRRLLTASFDNTAVITDVETGQPAVKLDNQFKAMCVALHPSNPEVFLCGGYSSAVKAWDSRSSKVVKVYKAGIQQTLDILFLRGGADFITSSDCVSRDSADRTLIAWDFQTTARLSNQIFQERYTCPSLALHPLEDCFVAQTNGNYMAVFSSQKPYRMNKRRRFEGHKVEGYAVQCEFSMDGSILASGSSTGSAHFYDYQNGRLLHALKAHSQPCLSAAQHPLLPSTTATCDWAGEMKVWH